MEPEQPNDIEFIPPGDIEFLTPSVNCWRCRLDYLQSLPKCPHCAAENKQSAVHAYRSPTTPSANNPTAAPKPIKIVFVTYGCILVTSIIMAAIAGAAAGAANEEDLQSTVIATTVAVELIDTFIVLIALATSGLALTRLRPAPSPPVAAMFWLLFSVGTAGMLWLNVAYHGFLTEVFKLPEAETGMPQSWPLLLILFCLQPAVIEELFCRQLCMAAFQDYVNIHLTVFLTAMMFALFHLFVPLSVPYLFLLGIFLGYARVWGGTVFLPIVLHFIHNLVVILIQGP